LSGALLLGLTLFVGVHSVSIVAPQWRDRTSARLGNAWRAAYSLIALAGLALIVYGYGAARQQPVVLYVPPPWLRAVAVPAMALVLPLLLAAYLPGRIQRTLRHPMLAAVKLWALAHLLVNGMLADVVLFGGLLLWAAADRASFRWRAPRPIKMAPARPSNDVIAVVGGLALYALLLAGGHTWLVGVPAVR
jgi:uncharacterized membrane protein